MHSAGPRTLAADRSVYALWPLATGCHIHIYISISIGCMASVKDRHFGKISTSMQAVMKQSQSQPKLSYCFLQEASPQSFYSQATYSNHVGHASFWENADSIRT